MCLANSLDPPGANKYPSLPGVGFSYGPLTKDAPINSVGGIKPGRIVLVLEHLLLDLLTVSLGNVSIRDGACSWVIPTVAKR
jgi:hypothetical protein